MIGLKALFLGIIAYLLGSIPFGILIARRHRVDIQKVGSKNPGATNVLRTVGKKAALFTLLGDLAKGAVAVLLGKAFSSSAAMAEALGLLAIIGHDWSIFNRLRGGKGVATSLGVFLALTPGPTLLALLVWGTALGISRYVSLASILAAAALPLLIFIFQGTGSLFFTSLAASALLILKHRSNIQRLIAGTEHKLTPRR
ncbi:MAG: glycerol-3-phosphate 1-O-acyltransferase PlsY [bacterium]|nr:glycerol-3-phosphate 1-O-acyltransferase PlsY [bacterium]